ncbi:hypothetical protein AMTRI_Chr04g246840 [Amborella trichopoda]
MLVHRTCASHIFYKCEHTASGLIHSSCRCVLYVHVTYTLACAPHCAPVHPRDGYTTGLSIVYPLHKTSMAHALSAWSELLRYLCERWVVCHTGPQHAWCARNVTGALVDAPPMPSAPVCASCTPRLCLTAMRACML